eukprot:10063611-Lingulodinium_polyedra.AAC.1
MRPEHAEAVIWLSVPLHCEELLLPTLAGHVADLAPVEAMRALWQQSGVHSAEDLVAWLLAQG